VLVLGDSMADWLAYGLEDALGDPPDLAVVRKNRATSGLIRYDSRNETQDWGQVIREAIAQTKPKFIVMMLGLNDRVSIRDRIPIAPPGPGSKTAAPAAAPAPAPEPSATPPNAKSDNADAEQPPAEQQPVMVAPEQQPKVGYFALRTYEFRSDEWAAYYEKRIDATVVALKSAGVPVFWVGLPSIRGPKSTSDMQYLNDLYRARVEKAGVNYIDVWDGFVDDSGRFIPQGADFEGQTRRLRAGDGVHFTRAGARKLAHYLEREIRRMMMPGSEPVALPSSEPQAPVAGKPSGPAARPLAGPVVPLTASAATAQELIGPRDASEVSGSKSVVRVLVNGEAIASPAGRADDFKWPRRAIAPVGADPIVATTTEPIPVMKPAPETTVAAPNSETRPVAAANPATRKTTTTVRASPPPQWQQPNRSPGFFSFFR
jgi:lysophospholipase L1-like esterase